MLATRLLLVAAVVIWGWTFVATRVCLEVLSPARLTGLRCLIGVPVLGAILLARRQDPRVERADLPVLAAGALVFTLHFLVQTLGLTMTSATNGAWIIGISPLVLAVLSAMMLRERPALRLWVGAVIATAGVVLLVSRGRLEGLTGIRSAGDALVLVSAHTWAIYSILTKRLSSRYPALGVTMLVMVPLAAAGAGEVVGRGLPRLTGPALAGLLFLGVLGTAAQWFWQIAIARMGAARAGMYLYLEPLATMTLAVPLLQEDVVPATVAGGGLVLAGLWWAEHRRVSRRP